MGLRPRLDGEAAAPLGRNGRIAGRAVDPGARARVRSQDEPLVAAPAGADPRTSRADRWSALPPAPLRKRDGSVVVWTGRSLLVWGGEIGTPAGTSTPPRFLADGAAFTPTG